MDSVLNILLSSLLVTASMPGYIYGGLIFFALIPLFLSMEKKGPFLSAIISFIYFFIFSLVNFNYIIDVLLKGLPELFGRFSPSMGMVVYLLFCVIEALPFLIFGFLYGLWIERIRFRFLKPIFVASLYVIAEYLRGIGDLAFTGGRLSDALYNFGGLLQLLRFTGTLGLVFLIVVVNYEGYKLLRKNRWNLVAIFAIFSLIVTVNGIIESRLPNSVGTKPIVVIQTNVPQKVKYDYPADVILNYLKEHFSNTPNYLTVLPEAVFPGEDIRNSHIETQLLDLFTDRTFILGFPTIESANVYNSLVVYSNRRFFDKYDKVKLFPFVETLPYSKIFGKFEFLKGIYYFTPGIEKTISINDYGKIGLMICFESFFPSLSRKLSANSELLIVATNDGWYSSKIALKQHFVQTVFRAIENNRFVIQVSNTGLSGVSDPYGHFSLLPYGTNWKVLYYTPINSITFYAKYGDWLFLLSLIIVLISSITLKKRSNSLFD